MSKNRITATISPYHCKLIKGAAQVMGKTQSQIVADAVKQRFDNMPQSERERILNKG